MAWRNPCTIPKILTQSKDKKSKVGCDICLGTMNEWN